MPRANVVGFVYTLIMIIILLTIPVLYSGVKKGSAMAPLYSYLREVQKLC